MGSNASKGSDNDELVDNLLKDQYLKTPRIQQIFRAVDRGLYFTKDYREHAYDDTAWRSGNIHISAPGIYCEVMENLELGQGMSFLNLGSGTGYLNTMAGLIIGAHGVNYGVEVYKEVIEYAYNRLDKFQQTAEAIDEYDFCEPKFFQGNCLHLSSKNKLFDRVYCGAACPPSYENYMKNLIKINGILVMPLEEVLVKVRRTSETSWEKNAITPVNFANMILPSPCDANKPQLLLSNPEPLPLQVICRSSIRKILLSIIREENPKLKNHRIRKEFRIPSRRNCSDEPADLLDRDPSFRMFLLHKRSSPFYPWVSPDNDDDDEDDDNSSREREESELEKRELDEGDEGDEDMERNEKQTEDNGDVEETSRCPGNMKGEGTRFNGAMRDEDDKESSRFNGRMKEDDDEEASRSNGRMKRKKAHQSSTSSSDSSADIERMEVEAAPAEEEVQKSKKTEKMTSELGGESKTRESSAEKSSDGAGCSNNRNADSSAESDDEDGKGTSRIVRTRFVKLQERMFRQYHQHMASMKKYRKFQEWSLDKKIQESDEEGEEDEARAEPPNVSPSPSELMREKIRALPLPPTIQSYLNFHRTF